MSSLSSQSLSRRGLLSLPLASAAPAILGARAASDRPNVVFLVTDDQRWDTLGCMGNRIVRTPHLDRLASEGVTFTNSFVTTSICMTSRASIFTGLYARAHQINTFDAPLPERLFALTYTERLRGAGYRTGFIGKYGVGKDMPAQRFDYWRGFPGQGRYYQQREGRFAHLTEIMGDQALEFLGGSRPGQPFCLSVSFKAAHVQDEDPRQFLYDPAHKDWYKDAVIPPPKTAAPAYIAQLPTEVQRSEGRRRWAVRFGTPELYQESVRSYYRLITEVDIVVGRIRDQLRRMDADRNTVIVFTGDNGFYLAEHGLAGKWLMHEESIRTPLLILDPRLGNASRGLRRPEMTLNIDLSPTVLEAAQLPIPPCLNGRSLYPLLRNQQPAWRKDWFYEHHFEAGGWIPPTEGVRTEDWKYTLYLKTEPRFEELFDLKKDPHEERNLAAEPAHRATLEAMRARHQTWVQRLESWSPDAAWSEPPPVS